MWVCVFVRRNKDNIYSKKRDYEYVNDEKTFRVAINFESQAVRFIINMLCCLIYGLIKH